MDKTVGGLKMSNCRKCKGKLRLTKKKRTKEIVYFCDNCQNYYDCEALEQLEVNK